MIPLKSLLPLILLSLAVNIYSAESFEFNPQTHTALIQADYIGFIDSSSNEKTGPELFIDEANTDFFNLIKSMINSAVADNKTINLMYENINSQNHGEYKRIIPDF